MSIFVTLSEGNPFGVSHPTQRAAFDAVEAVERPRHPADADVQFGWHPVAIDADAPWELYVVVDGNEYATGYTVEESTGATE